MMTLNSSKVTVAAIIAISAFAVFFEPDLSSYGATSRSLGAAVIGERYLQDKPTPPPAVNFDCPEGQEQYSVSWAGTNFQRNLPKQKVYLSNGMGVTVTVTNIGSAIASNYKVEADGSIQFTVKSIADATDVIDRLGEANPE